MGRFSVPEEIRKMKPIGTMVKNISNNYYVYEYKTITDSKGKRYTKMGKMIGIIKKDIGFIANDNFNRKEEISSLEFGQYAVVMANTEKVLELLKTSFNLEDAIKIYMIGIIHFINGFTYLKDIKEYYDMSILSLRYPKLKMGYDALSSLYDSLGRRQKNVIRFEDRLIAESTKQVAIDGHAIGSKFEENDLSEKGYKFGKIGEQQINLLMAYDVNTQIPLISRIYEGASSDRVSIKDFLKQIELKEMLFIADRGFYSNENIELFTNKGNQYIIPLSKNLKACKQAARNLEFSKRFTYQKGKRATVIEYKEEIINNQRILTYRDIMEAAIEQDNYIRHINFGDKKYKREKYEELKDLMAVTILQTNIKDKSAKEVYELYKNRWSKETFYNYFKNRANYNSLHAQDYHKTQGLAFIMLISALIYREFKQQVERNVKGKSVTDCLLQARMIKIHKRINNWQTCNLLSKHSNLFNQLNTNILSFIPKHT